MGQKNRLTAEERELFARISDVFFTNPFDDARREFEALALLGIETPAAPDEHHFAAVVPALDACIEQLERRGLGTIRSAEETDRRLLEHAFLYQLYHQYVDDFDRLIHSQIARGQELVEAPFGNEILRRLHARGFDTEQSLRYLALFYQFRRAFYFIGHALVGDSVSMRRLRRSLWQNVFTHDVRVYADHLWNRMEDFSTLLLGETGTGKGSAAAAIGRSGPIPFDVKHGCFTHSFTEIFIATNLSQFSETLIESELFGHRKGAFTGAVDHYKGLFERCSSHGSLFLDEIGEVSTPIQIKLLNVLQDRVFTPVGSHQELRFEGRMIAATNRSPSELRDAGDFREDFFYRLCSDLIEVPPLRRRLAESPSELHQLVQLLVARMTGQQSPDLVAMVVSALERQLPPRYPWPGNVRELEQGLRRILLNQRYEGLARSPVGPTEERIVAGIRSGALTAAELLSQYCAMLYERFGSYEEVARQTGLDRRTAKKHIETGKAGPSR